ncbi:hypothetical protein [Streptomyces clavuligerus]|uniref:Secreted protein n=1 Tax=Streptomyces clavuligerus TaxID=1901 RepID=E2Q896_STRCL|nr:hypothetical protein [Streptomyces clavuligerus]ANW21423.1 hypothetical protein BB341_26030 [Streptomyces clavuligerus]AXU16055.1 hypothetical protein D1794_27050 [Streptomyces clavuligerus]EFG05428.1 Hypothetical protein SCLAV_0352 [Streptomyces clavuligerus]MBY6306190.1 hypothetical protein [Streptomyces clavuligerus]QCS08833.1 hypothetical protein CRV15_26415 [Streptomyces clavuligerus]
MRRNVTALLTSLVATAAVLAGAQGARAAAPERAPERAPQPTGGAAVQGKHRPTAPPAIDGGAWESGHLQGTALDLRKGFMYFSFTNLLVKTDLRGTPVGSVTGFTGHLGDMDFNRSDGRVYASLEYKAAQAFYVAIFDADRITRMNMDAETTGVVSTVHLKEVVEDYTADMNGDGVFDGNTGNTPDHRYGCSGIDGIAFGPAFGRPGRERLTVAYGVYSNTTRADNDHQVLLQYDVRRWRKYERPLTEADPHTSGPSVPDGKFFVYTGNTTYGVQNLEYDDESGDWLMAVYKGKKKTFPNYSLFVVDGSERPYWGQVRGQAKPEYGKLLTLLPQGLHHVPSGVYGFESAGQYGLIALDDGRFYLAEAGRVESGGIVRQTGRVVLHTWTGLAPNPFAPLPSR